jgi:hypothetical protein
MQPKDYFEMYRKKMSGYVKRGGFTTELYVVACQLEVFPFMSRLKLVALMFQILHNMCVYKILTFTIG